MEGMEPREVRKIGYRGPKTYIDSITQKFELFVESLKSDGHNVKPYENVLNIKNPEDRMSILSNMLRIIDIYKNGEEDILVLDLLSDEWEFVKNLREGEYSNEASSKVNEILDKLSSIFFLFDKISIFPYYADEFEKYIRNIIFVINNENLPLQSKLIICKDSLQSLKHLLDVFCKEIIDVEGKYENQVNISRFLEQTGAKSLSDLHDYRITVEEVRDQISECLDLFDDLKYFYAKNIFFRVVNRHKNLLDIRYRTDPSAEPIPLEVLKEKLEKYINFHNKLGYGDYVIGLNKYIEKWPDIDYEKLSNDLLNIDFNIFYKHENLPIDIVLTIDELEKNIGKDNDVVVKFLIPFLANISIMSQHNKQEDREKTTEVAGSKREYLNGIEKIDIVLGIILEEIQKQAEKHRDEYEDIIKALEIYSNIKQGGAYNVANYLESVLKRLEEKEKGLGKNGLREYISDTFLILNRVKRKVEEMTREILFNYIISFEIVMENLGDSKSSKALAEILEILENKKEDKFLDLDTANELIAKTEYFLGEIRQENIKNSHKYINLFTVYKSRLNDYIKYTF